MSHLPPRGRVSARLRPITAALAALLVLPAGASAADATVSATPGESFASTTASVVAIGDAAAEDGRTLALYGAGTATATVKTSTSTTSLTFRARATQCDGSPTVNVAVDGVSAGTFALTETSYHTYTSPKALAAGTHTVALKLTNDYKTSSCDRDAFVDTVRTLAPATALSLASPAVAPATVAPKLRWPAPALTAPTTVAVPQGNASLTLDKTKDYVVNLGGAVHQGALSINGGRNVVLKGGTIALPASSTKVSALFITNSTGVVHVEGVLFDGSAHEMDAVQISAPAATVQLENIRAVGITGSFSTNHSDVVQPWGGVKALRIDRLTADSNYQGIFTRPDQGAIGSVDLQNVDLAFNNAALVPGSGGYLLWMTSDCAMAPTTLTNVYVTPKAGASVGAAVWPATNDSKCPSKLSSNTVTFPKLPVTGGVIGGAPATGSFVPAGKAGVSYTSPGYQ